MLFVQQIGITVKFQIHILFSQNYFDFDENFAQPDHPKNNISVVVFLIENKNNSTTTTGFL